jgi:hypothetical protein
MTGSASSGSPGSGGPARRYTIEFRLEPDRGRTRVRSVTPMGERMAVFLATARLFRKRPDAQVSAVDVVGVEDEFTIDPAEDALDYWALEG